MVWRELDNFSSNSMCLVLASRVYEESDYYRDYEDFRRAHAEASSWAEVAVREQPNHFIATCVAAASNALTARLPEAQKAMASLRQLDPDLRLSNLKDLFPIRRMEDFTRWAEGMRRAGLPE